MKLIPYIALIFLIPAFFFGLKEKISRNAFLDAICQVESGGDSHAIGDGGKAIGPYQIHKSYWQDAIEYDKTIGGCYEDCFQEDYARNVISSYMRRYAQKAWVNNQFMRLASIHHLGPSGRFIDDCEYWCKVSKEMEK